MSIEFDVSSHVHTCALRSVRLLVEFEASRAAGGNGTHREPSGIFREFRAAVLETCDAARAACDAIANTRYLP